MSKKSCRILYSKLPYKIGKRLLGHTVEGIVNKKYLFWSFQCISDYKDHATSPTKTQFSLNVLNSDYNTECPKITANLYCICSVYT